MHTWSLIQTDNQFLCFICFRIPFSSKFHQTQVQGQILLSSRSLDTISFRANANFPRKIVLYTCTCMKCEMIHENADVNCLKAQLRCITRIMHACTRAAYVCVCCHLHATGNILCLQFKHCAVLMYVCFCFAPVSWRIRTHEACKRFSGASNFCLYVHCIVSWPFLFSWISLCQIFFVIFSNWTMSIDWLTEALTVCAKWTAPSLKSRIMFELKNLEPVGKFRILYLVPNFHFKSCFSLKPGTRGMGFNMPSPSTSSLKSSPWELFIFHIAWPVGWGWGGGGLRG